MEKKEIEKRITILEDEINTRKNELKALRKELSSILSFREKFSIWYNSGDANQLPFIVNGPVRAWCDKNIDLGSIRGCVNLCEYEEFEMYASPGFEYWESKEEGKKIIEKLESDELFMAACKHMMDENFDSFQMDW